MAALADSNIGFKGEVTSAETPTIFGKGSRYSVEGTGDLKVTVGGAGDRAVTVAAGAAWGDGVLSTFDTSAVLNASANATGSDRWDTVVIRREWTPAGTPTGTATLMILSGGTSRAISTARTTDRGKTTSDQPLALIRIANGAGTVAEVVNIRCWAGDGGLVAEHSDARQYLADPGTRVRIGTKEHVRVINGSGNAEWAEFETDPEVVSTFGSSSSGWTYAGTAQGSELVRDGKRRTLFLEQKRTSGSGILPTATGSIGNFQSFALNDPSDWPNRTVYTTGAYYGDTGADYSCTGVIQPDGRIEIIHMSPNAELAGGQTASGAWSLRQCATWYVP